MLQNEGKKVKKTYKTLFILLCSFIFFAPAPMVAEPSDSDSSNKSKSKSLHIRTIKNTETATEKFDHSNDDQIFHNGLTQKAVLDILQKTHLDFEMSKDEWKDPQFYIYLDNRQEVVLWFYGCKDKKCQDIRLWTYFPMKNQKIPYVLLNQWNAQNRWTKAYLDKDLDAIIEMDLDTDSGITEGALLNFIEIYISHVYKFDHFISQYIQNAPKANNAENTMND